MQVFLLLSKRAFQGLFEKKGTSTKNFGGADDLSPPSCSGESGKICMIHVRVRSVRNIYKCTYTMLLSQNFLMSKYQKSKHSNICKENQTKSLCLSRCRYFERLWNYSTLRKNKEHLAKAYFNHNTNVLQFHALKAHRLISRKRSFERSCSCDEAC